MNITQKDIDKLAAKLYHTVYVDGNYFKLNSRAASLSGFKRLAKTLLEGGYDANNGV